MAKLPVNLLLYSLYAASLGLVGGIGWNFYTTLQLRNSMTDRAVMTALKNKVEEHLKAGREAQPARQSWRYDADMRDKWWTQFGALNIIGKLPPPPAEEKPAQVEEKKPEDTGVPLDKIMVLEALLLDSGPASAQKSHVVIRYRPEANVQPPAEVVGSPSVPTASIPAPRFSPGDATRPATGGAPAVAPMPMPGGAVDYRQFVKLGDKLWPPYSNIRLDSIASDGLSALFVREDPKVEEAQWKKESLFKNELELDAELVKQLVTARRSGGRSLPTNDPGNQSSPLDQQTWQDVSETRAVSPGNVHVSRKDYDYLRDNSDKVINDEIGVSSYTGRYSGQQGVRLDRVSPRVSSLGFQAGDVIVSVNGEKVANRAQAINVGRKQYEAGRRTFVVEVLSGAGTGVETRTITVPNR